MRAFGPPHRAARTRRLPRRVGSPGAPLLPSVFLPAHRAHDGEAPHVRQEEAALGARPRHRDRLARRQGEGLRRRRHLDHPRVRRRGASAGRRGVPRHGRPAALLRLPRPPRGGRREGRVRRRERRRPLRHERREHQPEGARTRREGRVATRRAAARRPAGRARPRGAGPAPEWRR